jgi:hypothetical protein
MTARQYDRLPPAYPQVPPGYCQCGCGKKTNINKITWHRFGMKAGEPNRFLRGHQARKGVYFEGIFVPVRHTRTKTGRHKATRWYAVYRSMMSRCYNPKSFNGAGKKYYIDRGINVCKRWRGHPEAFYVDMGEPPRGKVLDRRNSNRGYSPSNCRWATWFQSNQNKIDNVFNWKLVREVRRRAQRETAEHIANDLQINRKTVQDVINHHTWKEFPGVARA